MQKEAATLFAVAASHLMLMQASFRWLRAIQFQALIYCAIFNVWKQ